MPHPAKILYFGNRLEGHGFSPTGIDRLSVLLANDFEVITASRVRNPVLRMLDMMLTALRHRDADYVLIDTYSTSAFYYAWVLACLSCRLGIPYVPILHGGNLSSRLDGSPSMSRQVFSRSLTNVAPSRFLDSIFKDRGFPVKVIPNPINLEDYTFRRRHEVGPRLLYVRAFDRTYNPGLAVRILEQLTARHPEAALCMVGPDKDGMRSAVETLARELNVHDRVRFTGKLAPEVWRKVSCDYDIFINTTDVDNTPLSVLEAMALGLPVISTSVGGLPDLVTDGVDGFLVDRDAPDQFVERINRLMRDPALVAKLTWNGRNTAEAFSSARIRLVWREFLSTAAQEALNPPMPDMGTE